MTKLAVGILGYGYWGPNLFRNFSACPHTQVTAICDLDPVRLESLKNVGCPARLINSLDEFLALPLDAVAIATPVATHFDLAQRCLERKLHVLVEKPLASTVEQARTLVELADRNQCVLMVDHTYLFTNAVRRIKDLVESGELGELYYIDSIRINLGLFRHDVNVVWDLAPHDLSIVEYVLGQSGRSISAWGRAHADPAIEDVAYVNVDYEGQTMASFHVNWLSPVKVRQMIFAGSRKSLIFNELNTSEPIKIYDRGIDLGETDEDRRRLMISYRSGDIHSPHIAAGEALQAVVTHFAECIRNGTVPLSDGMLGVRVVQMLEAATRSIQNRGARVVLSQDIPDTRTHHHARQTREGQLSPNLPGRSDGEERRDPLLRQPVRLPGRG